MMSISIKKIKDTKVSIVNSTVEPGGVVNVDQSNKTINLVQNSNNSEQPANTLIFDSSDTLVITKLLNKLSNDGIRKCDCTVLINGYDNYIEENCFIEAVSVVGNIDGYIRTLIIEEPSRGQLLEVGGCNSTQERIAAKDFKLILSKAAYAHLTDTVSSFYDANLKKELDHNKLYGAVKFNEPKKTIAIAKQIKDETSLRVILNLMEDNNHPKLMSLITESIKSFKNLFLRNPKIAAETLHRLQSFIRRNVSTKEYSNAVVYAIESMGYVSKVNKKLQKNHSRFLVNMLCSNYFVPLHRHLLWASLVSLKNIILKDKEIDKLSNILSSFGADDENFECVNKIGNSILYNT